MNRQPATAVPRDFSRPILRWKWSRYQALEKEIASAIDQWELEHPTCYMWGARNLYGQQRLKALYLLDTRCSRWRDDFLEYAEDHGIRWHRFGTWVALFLGQYHEEPAWARA